MIRKAMIVLLPVLLLGSGCKSPAAYTTTSTVHDALPAIEIDEALALAREAAALEYEIELYAVDHCERHADGWWISYAARPVEEVGARWSRLQKEQWLAMGNHFSVYVYNDRTIRLFGGR